MNSQVKRKSDEMNWKIIQGTTKLERNQENGKDLE